MALLSRGVLLILLAASISANATSVMPLSYDMNNGTTGSYSYWDDLYSGSGNITANGAPLAGGLGDLTDGVIATQNWNITEAPVGPGPYVGWLTSPLITFHFGSPKTIKSFSIYYDDANGYGGVRTPAGVAVWSDGVSQGGQYVADDPGSAPNVFTWTFSGSGITTTDLLLQITHQFGSWVFISEIQFDDGLQATSVPEPSTPFLLVLALLGVVELRRRMTRQSNDLACI